MTEPPAAFEFTKVSVLRAGRRVLDEVTASIPAVGITVVTGPSVPARPPCCGCATG